MSLVLKAVNVALVPVNLGLIALVSIQLGQGHLLPLIAAPFPIASLICNYIVLSRFHGVQA